MKLPAAPFCSMRTTNWKNSAWTAIPITTNRKLQSSLRNWSTLGSGCLLYTSDKPKREDFVQDNLQLEELVGGHIEDTEAHLTAENREQFSTPVKVGVYAGDGKEA